MSRWILPRTSTARFLEAEGTRRFEAIERVWEVRRREAARNTTISVVVDHDDGDVDPRHDGCVEAQVPYFLKQPR